MTDEWDNRWMGMADEIAKWSKDKSTKTGAVIVDDRNVVISLGWNGFPRGINDDIAQRHERPLKYKWTEHAERNAIYNAAAKGHATVGCRMYVCWYPCADCARAIIQAGLIELIAIEPNWEDARWGEDFSIVKEMLLEAKVNVRFLGQSK